MIEFHRQADNTFTQSGSLPGSTGRFQWLRDGIWDGGWSIEPVQLLLDRMNQPGPYKYESYRIVEAANPPLDILPSCHECGFPAGIYNPTTLDAEDPLIDFDKHHQVQVSIPVLTKGKNYGKTKMKPVTFCSVACANLTLKRMARTEYRNVVSYDGAQTIGQCLRGQGYKRCEVCRQVNKGDCSRICQEKYADQVKLIRETAALVEKNLECLHCGETFPALRSTTARYCSKSCRQKAGYLRQTASQPHIPPYVQNSDTGGTVESMTCKLEFSTPANSESAINTGL